jgi:hypothetical protein
MAFEEKREWRIFKIRQKLILKVTLLTINCGL